MTLRQRTTEAVMNLLSGQKEKLNWMLTRRRWSPIRINIHCLIRRKD